jgi:tight adherence protein B
MFVILIAVASFVGVACLVAGVWSMLGGSQTTSAEVRLQAYANGRDASAANGPSSKGLLSSPLEDASGLLENFAKRFNVRKYLDQADMTVAPTKLLLIIGGLGVGGALLWAAVAPMKFLAPLVGIALALIPVVFVYFKRKRRLNKFTKQLPDALDLVGRALRAGHALGSGMKMVADESPEPIGSEFRRCFDEQNFGVPLEESLQGLCERIPTLDVRFFVTAVILQRQTGGDLAEILDKIGHLVRERFKIWGAIQALTGEGRLSGIVLLALPPVLFIVMWRLNPGYVMVLFDDPLGNKMLAVGLVMQLLGAIVIKKIIDIKV